MRNIKYFFVVLSLIGLASCEKQDDSQQLRIFIESGNSYYEQGQFRPAMIEVQNALQLDPLNEQAAIVAAKIYMALGRGRSSVSQLEAIEGKSLEYFQTLVDVYINRRKFGSALHLLRQQKKMLEQDMDRYELASADAYIGLGEVETAQKLYLSVRDRGVAKLPAQLGLATVQVIRGDLVTAEQQTIAVLAEFPRSVDAMILFAATHIRQGRLQQAEENLTEAVTLLPTMDLFTMERARIVRTLIALLARQGRTGEALVYQRMLAEAFPRAQEITAQIEAAIGNIQEGQMDEAEALLGEILANSPGDELTGSLLGMLKYFKGDFEAADQHFAASVDAEIAPTHVLKYMATNMYQMGQLAKVVSTLEGRVENSRDPHLVAIYGISALNSNKIEAGLKALRRAITLDPNNPRLSLILSQYYNDQDPPNHQQALSEIASALENNPDERETQTAYMNQLLRMNLLDDAATFVAQKLSENPKDSHALLFAGSLSMQLGNFDEATGHFGAVLAGNPRDINAQFGQALVYVRQEQWNKARGSYRLITQLAPEDIRAYRGLMQAYEALDQVNEGIKTLGEMSDGGNEYASTVISEYLTANGRLGEAQAFVDKIGSYSTDSPQTRRLIAQVGYRRTLAAIEDEDYGVAREAVFKALNAFPANIKLLTLLAQIEIRTGQFVEAEKIITEFREFHKDSHVPDILAGDLASAKQEYGRAVQHYVTGWQQDQNDAMAVKVFQAHVANSNPVEAEAFTYEWEAKLPGSAIAIINRAELQPNPDMAINVYEQWQASTEPSAPVLNNLAWLYLEVDRIDDGLRVATQAYGLAPDDFAVVDTYGWLLYKAGDLKKAQEYLGKAAQMNPDSGEIRDHLDTVRGAARS